MQVIDFLFPPQAGDSVNAPHFILMQAKPYDNSTQNCWPGDLDEETANQLFRLEFSDDRIRQAEVLLDWLESEGLWYLWRDGLKLKKAYLPGANFSPLHSNLIAA